MTVVGALSASRAAVFLQSAMEESLWAVVGSGESRSVQGTYIASEEVAAIFNPSPAMGRPIAS